VHSDSPDHSQRRDHGLQRELIGGVPVRGLRSFLNVGARSISFAHLSLLALEVDQSSTCSGTGRGRVMLLLPRNRKWTTLADSFEHSWTYLFTASLPAKHAIPPRRCSHSAKRILTLASLNARHQPSQRTLARGVALMGEQKIFRCAVYTRKSSEEGLEQDFNSLEAQREACEAYIRSQSHEGWKLIVDRFDDGGFSGGNMERPALGKLMGMIREGKVDVIVIYKIDRLTRSLTDFARLAEPLTSTASPSSPLPSSSTPRPQWAG